MTWLLSFLEECLPPTTHTTAVAAAAADRVGTGNIGGVPSLRIVLPLPRARGACAGFDAHRGGRRRISENGGCGS